MWKSRKVVLLALLAVALLAGSTAGIALAQDDGGDVNTSETRCGAMMEKVCEMYQANTGVSLDAGQLKNAFTQAQRAMREEAMANRLQGLVDEGTITQGEADEYLEWWHAMPDTLQGLGEKGPGSGGFRGGRMHCGPGPGW